MLGYFRDRFQTASLKARYRRIVQERLLSLVEVSGPQPVAEEPGSWTLLGGGAVGETARVDLRSRARDLVVKNPHARNVVRLLEIYVAGPGLKLSHRATQPDADVKELTARADALWEQFLRVNARHFTFREYARRTWRDGECFLRKFATPSWPPSVRFMDPEAIGTPAQMAENHGIVTEPGDVETPVAYLRIDPRSRELAEQIPADEVFHTKVGVDSNQKRGLTVLSPVLGSLEEFDKWLETEMLARRLQSSIVLWRKIQGGPSEAGAFADAAETGTRTDLQGTTRRERIRGGTILTTSQGTDLQFLQPNTNFADAVPLGRLVLLCVAAGAGVPEFMLTSDASNANFASTMVAEGPAVKMFQAEQQFFIAEFDQIRRWVMSEAIRAGLLPENFHHQADGNWSAPQLVNRDRPRERSADVKLVGSQILSRAEVARRDGMDPALMRAEIAAESGGE